MEARYLTDDKGNRVGVLLDIKEYERLREIEDEMEDVRRYDAAVAARERGDDTIPWEQVRDHIGSEYRKHTD
jgi:hypothetical protein